MIILAEDSSGKTAEFMTRSVNSKNSFFVSIEDLADEGFGQLLASQAVSLFENWKLGFDFLDLVDEARLNRKSFERALKKFAHAVSQHLERCRIFISCRVTDWKGQEDYQSIAQLLLLSNPANLPLPEIDPEAALIAPLFKNRATSTQDEDEKENTDDEIVVVRLAPLNNQQQRTLAQGHGVEKITEFCSSIWQHGLDNLAERPSPGDLLEMVAYWNQHKNSAHLLK